MKNNTFFSFCLIMLICTSCDNSNRILLEKAEHLIDSAPDSALMYLDSINVHFLSVHCLDRFHLATIQAKDKARRSIAKDTMIFSLRGKYDNSDSRKAILAYLYSGKVLEQHNDYEGAILSYLDAKNVDSSINDNQGLIISAIGNLHYQQRDVQQAKVTFMEALKLFEERHDTKNIMITQNQLGNCYLVLAMPDSAFYYYGKCKEKLSELNNFPNKAGILNNLAVGYQMAGEIDTAKAYLYEALTFETNDKYKARIYLNLAELSGADKDTFYHYTHKALAYMDMETESYDPMIMSTIYAVMATYEEKQRNYELALNYQKEYIYHQVKFYERKEETDLKELQKKYDLRVVEQKNMDLLIKQQNIVIAGCFILILLALSVYLSAKQRQKLNEALDQIDCLRELADADIEKEKSLRSVVLYNFKILKKVALLERQAISSSSGKPIIKRMNEILYGQDKMDWNQLYKTMNALHDNLFDKLKESFTQLEDIEFKICCLSVAKFTNIEIGILLGYSVNTISAKKAIMRKKMGIPTSGNILKFLNDYFSN